MLHASHLSFLIWASVLCAAAAAIVVTLLSRVVRRHLARLAVCLAIGAVTAFGFTAWADGQRHAALAAGARAGHGHAVSVAGQLVPAFIVITVVVASVALAVSGFAARRQGRHYAQYDEFSQYGQRPARRGRYSAGRRGW